MVIGNRLVRGVVGLVIIVIVHRDNNRVVSSMNNSISNSINYKIVVVSEAWVLLGIMAKIVSRRCVWCICFL